VARDAGSYEEEFWNSNKPLNWEEDFMSEETKMLKEALKKAAEGAAGAAEELEFIFVIVPDQEIQQTLHPGFVPTKDCPSYPCSL
jgi:hypothetical protein